MLNYSLSLLCILSWTFLAHKPSLLNVSICPFGVSLVSTAKMTICAKATSVTVTCYLSGKIDTERDIQKLHAHKGASVCVYACFHSELAVYLSGQTSSYSSVNNMASHHTETQSAAHGYRTTLLIHWFTNLMFCLICCSCIPQHVVRLWAVGYTSDTSDTEDGSPSLRTSFSHLHRMKTRAVWMRD